VIDVTERQLAEEELKNKTLELQELNFQKDKLFSIIAHDLRSPFNSIIGFSDLLASKARELPLDKVEDYARLVRESAAGVHDLLDNLLAWASIQMRGGQLNARPLDLKRVVQASVGPLAHMAKDKKVLIENGIGAVRPLGDEPLVRIVIRNLVSNGIKFSHGSGRVRLDAETTSVEGRSMVRVSVADSGVGMEPETLQRLFDLHDTASKPGTGGEHGTGLGLYLCRDIVMRHGGEIHVSSEPGSGTNVQFTLPAA
ncbi:MAG: HAMP domain-containing sensor histidine kinase, partial [Rhodospirillaceae bacterium]